MSWKLYHIFRHIPLGYNTKYLNLTKVGLFFNIICSAVHTFLPSVLQCLDPGGIEVLFLTLKKILNSGNDVIISLFQQDVFSSLGTENNSMVPNQENMEGDQSVQSHNHAQRTLQPETCE